MTPFPAPFQPRRALTALLTVLLTSLLAACGPEDAPDPPAGAGPEIAAPASADPPPPETGAEDLSEVVATINGEPLTRRILASQVDLAAAEVQPYDAESGGEADRAARLRDIRVAQLRNLIYLELACQEALRLGYAPAEEELAEALKLFEKDFEAPEQLYKVLDQYGSTEDDLKKQMIKSMALKRWQADEFLAEITVSEAEALDFYQRNSDLLRHGEMVRLSQILVSVPLLADPSAKARARSLAETAEKRLKAGEEFGVVAAEVNSDPEAAENRGDQGWFVRGQSLPVIEGAVWSLPVGGRSGLLESMLGFHIVQVTGRRPAGLDSFESLRIDIVDFLSAQKLEAVLDRKMDELIRAADIEILDEELKAALPAPPAEAGED